jgi:NAD(P)-dependent dehydrogenase (short-subunit alcohol dehydrogenase family)
MLGPMSDGFLQGRVALVTGASRGLGRAIALALGEAGATLALNSRNADNLADVAALAQSRGVKAVAVPADVTDEVQVGRLAAQLRDQLGNVDILVNNAGVNIRKDLTEFTLAEWRQVLDTNLTGAFLMCRAVLPMMRGRGYGRIINLTSIMSHVALPGRTAYAASKTGLLGLTRALALELAPERITVNGISPGPVATAMNAPILQSVELSREFTSRIPLGRWGAEDEVARLALYLCSDAAAFITGTDLVIDGGWTAQ